VDEKTHRPSATVVYDVVNAATNKAVVHLEESTEKMGNIGDQITLEKALPLNAVDAGVYRVNIKVNDHICEAKTPKVVCSISPTARFAVEDAATAAVVKPAAAVVK
jgi:hypothetical protein